MVCDVATARFKNAIRHTNIFTPTQLLEKLVGVKGLVPIFLRGNDRELPFRTGWADVLGKCVKKPPPEFTANFHFEFREDGTMDLRPSRRTARLRPTCSWRTWQQFEKRS